MTTAFMFPPGQRLRLPPGRYRLQTAPLFVYCCHCRWCQRESGSAFAQNAMIESGRVSLLAGSKRR